MAPSTSAKPTIVLIHGGWQVPASYAKLTGALRRAGYEVHVPRHPSTNGSRPPNADLATDSAQTRAYVERVVEAGRTVVAVMHSYGGQVGTKALASNQGTGSGKGDGLGEGLGVEARAARGLPGGVSQLIYVCAFSLPEGRSMVDKVREFGHEALLPLAFDFAADDSCVHRDPKKLLVGDGVSRGWGEEDEAAVDAFVDTMVHWNGRCMYQGVSRCAWREISTAYVYTSADMTVPLDYQKSMVAAMEAEGRTVQTVELAAGHCPSSSWTPSTGLSKAKIDCGLFTAWIWIRA